MSVNYLHKKSNTASKRPTAASLDIGELALNYESGTPGVFFEDSSGLVRKVGPVEVSGTAPNDSPAGSSGNSIGEQWLDTSATPAILKTWNGTAWVEANGGTAGTLDGPVTFTAQAGENLTYGDVVYISGAAGDTPVVSKAQANSTTTMPAYGFSNATVSSGGTVTVITFGSIEGNGSTPINTGGLGVNDVVYVSAVTAGEWTTTKPTGEANLLQNIGRIQRVNSSNGVIKVGGAGRASATPNLDDGNIFVGNASNEAVTDAFTDVLRDQAGVTATVTSNALTLTDTLVSTAPSHDVNLGDGALFIDEGDGRIGVNSIVPTAALDAYGYFDNECLAASFYEDSVLSPTLSFRKGRGNNTTFAGVNAGDYLGMIRYYGYDGAASQLAEAARLTVATGDTTMSTSVYVIETAVSGTLAERLRINSVGETEVSGDIRINDGNGIRFREDSANGNNRIYLKAPAAVTANVDLTLPDGDGNSGQVMTSDGSGTLAFSTYGVCVHASFDASNGGSFSWPTDGFASGNVAAITRTGVGAFTIEFARNFASTAYTVVCTAGNQDNTVAGSSPTAVNVVARAIDSVSIVVEATDDGANVDSGYISLMAIGVLS